MDVDEILRSLKSGKTTLREAEKMLSLYSIEKVGEFARIDIDRQRRRGIPEVIFAEGKTADETTAILDRMMEKRGRAVVSRLRDGDYERIISYSEGHGWSVSRGKGSTALLVHTGELDRSAGTVGIITAGTSDIGIAEEARLVCEAMGCACHTVYDAGIAGMQRVFAGMREIEDADVDAIIVVAGMEGALATVVSSLADVPVIGVPASVGYGYGGDGIGALAAMLQSCSLGMSVVNIDNGIGAGAAAAAIARRAGKGRGDVSERSAGPHAAGRE